EGGDGAEGAAVVAAFAHLQVRAPRLAGAGAARHVRPLMMRGLDVDLRFVVAKDFGDDLVEAAHLADPDIAVGSGSQTRQLFAHPLRQAPGDDHPAIALLGDRPLDRLDALAL